MVDLWRHVASLARGLPAERVTVIARAIRALKGPRDIDRMKAAFGPNVDGKALAALADSWQANADVSANELASAFLGACASAEGRRGHGRSELVWTGPRTGLIPVRRTDQVLKSVIDSAQNHLFIVSFVFFNVPRLTDAMKRVIDRGVRVEILLESSSIHGGSLKEDCVAAMRDAVPGAVIYAWKSQGRKADPPFLPGKVHAKCAVADGRLAFITSANLTGAAMERNMEIGLLVHDGEVPDLLARHLRALVSVGLIEEVVD